MPNDVRAALRMLARARAFTVTALLILTLGVGATATMFSVSDDVLLRPLPYPQPERLVLVRETRAQAGFEKTVMAAKEFVEWTAHSRVLEDATIVDYPGLALAEDDRAPVRLSALRVSAGFFRLFGVQPAEGRAFTREAEAPGSGGVVLISDRVWRDRFGGAPDVVGRTVRVEARPATVIGILPAGFALQGRVDLVVPMALTPEQISDRDHSYDVYARLAPGVTREQAAAELTRIALATQDGPAHLTGATVVPLHEAIVGNAAASMLAMSGAVLCVLLIACANLANLLLARGASRQREIAIRAALGAGRVRVLRQLLTESLVLSAVGGVLGALLASWLTELLVRYAADWLPRANEVHVDATTVAFSVLIALASGLSFGIVPAWQAARTDVNDTLKAEARGASASRRRALSAFVVAEIALAMVLLVGAGLLLGTFAHLRRADPGFDAAHVLVVPAFVPAWKYPTPESQRAFFARAVTSLAGVPGVEAVGATDALPLSGDNTSGSVTIEGMPPPSAATRPNTDRRAVTPDFHRAMGIRLQAGRYFVPADDERALLVVIVSRSFADRFWPGQDAIGKRLKLARYEASEPWRAVVGVVNDVQHVSLADRPRPVVYYPHAQGPTRSMQLVVRAAGAPASVAGGVRAEMTRIDADLPVAELRPMTAYLAGALGETEIALWLLGSFAMMAMALAAAGVYGVMAYAVTQRRLEFGIRVALGASRRDVLRLVTSQGLRLTATGVAIGMMGAMFTSSLLGRFLVGVRPGDPRTVAATAAVVAVVAMTACLIPAVRAMRIAPTEALRAR